MGILDTIRSPADLRALDESKLKPLAAEMRGLILRTVRTNGGHLASNLGVVELTIALHRVFESPRDAIVWDVGHQCYAHKLLTGRAAAFSGLRRRDGISGFPKRSESEHDLFDTGHASTSISSALGLLEARLDSGDAGKVVAVIGDGALTGGMAFEALGHAGQLARPLIVVLNDNRMSISANVGALSRYLSRLSATVRYQAVRTRIDSAVRSIPRFGDELLDLVVRGKRAVKAILFPDNFFSDLGFEYIGPIGGHDIRQLTSVLRQAKRLGRPVVVHVVTHKGKGDEQAEIDPARFHGLAPSCADEPETAGGLAFTEVFGEAIRDLAAEDPRIVAITAAMSKGTGLEPMRKAMPRRVYDVGIAEQHAVTFAAGLAAGGMRPVVALYSTFLQRAADQVFHDVALPNLPVVFAVDRAGLVGEDGETHQGIYDMAMFRCMPHLTILAPSSAAELRLFLRQALTAPGPTMIRYPKAFTECAEDESVPGLEPGKGIMLRSRPGSSMLAIGLGPVAGMLARISDSLAREGLDIDVYSLRHAVPLDGEHLLGLCAGYGRVITAEEGVADGGAGQAIAGLLAADGRGVPVKVLGLPAVPPAQGDRETLLAEAGLDRAGLEASLRRFAAQGGCADDGHVEGGLAGSSRSEAAAGPAGRFAPAEKVS